MNILYEYKAKRTTKREIALIAIFIGAAIGFFSVPMLFADMQIAWLFQTSALVCFCGAIFVYTEFLAKEKVYRIVEDEEENQMFVIDELMSRGRKTMTVCCISLENIDTVTVFDNSSASDVKRKNEFAAAAKKEKRRRFSFYPEIAPAQICSILAFENGEKLLINIVPDKILIEALISVAEKNKTNLDTEEAV